jgi:hypothetical protein
MEYDSSQFTPAADYAKRSISKQDWKIITALEETGPAGLTRAGIAERTQISIRSVNARCNALLHDGLVIPSIIPDTLGTQIFHRKTATGKLAQVLILKERGMRVSDNIPEFIKLIEKSTIDLTQGLPIPPDVMEARRDLNTEIHRKISMFSFRFTDTQEGKKAEIEVKFANGVVHLMTLFCESLRGFYSESDGTLLGSFDFDPDGLKARARRCFTLNFKEGRTLDQIAAELDMHRMTVHRTLRGKIRPYIYFEWFGHWPDGKISNRYLSDEEGKEILKYHEQGLSFLEIACKTGRNRRTISDFIMAAGVPHFNRRNGAHRVYVSPHENLCGPEPVEKKTIFFNPLVVEAIPISRKNGR